ncbi:MAG: hypothetical protein ACLFOY_14285 [Desulfatibacillaceae bacterium]
MDPLKSNIGRTNRARIPGHILVALLAFALLHGCSWRPSTLPPPDAPDPAFLLAAIDARVESASPAKGVGSYRVDMPNRTMSGRVAWISAPPDRFRVEVLSPFGQPLAGLAMDGDTLYAHVRPEDFLYTGSPGTRAVREFLGVALEPEHLSEVLVGGMFTMDHDRAHVETWYEEGVPAGWVLTLVKDWGWVRQRIWIQPDLCSVARSVVYERPWFSTVGNPLYEIRFVRVDGDAREVSFTREPDATVQIRFQRFWPSADISGARFSLESAGSASP